MVSQVYYCPCELVAPSSLQQLLLIQQLPYTPGGRGVGGSSLPMTPHSRLLTLDSPRITRLPRLSRLSRAQPRGAKSKGAQSRGVQSWGVQSRGVQSRESRRAGSTDAYV